MTSLEQDEWTDKQRPNGLPKGGRQPFKATTASPGTDVFREESIACMEFVRSEIEKRSYSDLQRLINLGLLQLTKER